MLADITLRGGNFYFSSRGRKLPHECPRNEVKRLQRVWQNLAHGSLAHHSRFVKHIHVNPRRHSARGDRPEFPRTTLPSMICMQLWLCNFRATFISLCATFTCLYILVHTYMHAQCSKKICVCNNRSPFVTVVVLIRILFSTQIVVPINFLYSKWIHESEKREKERIQRINILCLYYFNKFSSVFAWELFYDSI